VQQKKGTPPPEEEDDGINSFLFFFSAAALHSRPRNIELMRLKNTQETRPEYATTLHSSDILTSHNNSQNTISGYHHARHTFDISNELLLAQGSH